MSNGRPKVLLFSTIRMTFVEDDLQLLQRIANVKWICSKGFLAIVKLKWAMLFRKVGIAWFASVYSGVMVFFSRLFRKESVIIIGGADVISDSRLGYGLLLSGWKRPIVRYAIRNATKVLPTSYYLNFCCFTYISNKSIYSFRRSCYFKYCCHKTYERYRACSSPNENNNTHEHFPSPLLLL